MPTNNSTNTSPAQYAAQVGGAKGTLSNVTPSVTTGVPLVSNGTSANPSFSTASVAGGGTGATSLTGILTGNGTSAVTATAITQYNVLTAGASNVPNSVAPTATSGVPLISQGSSSQPIFGTAVVAGGGTGDTSFTAYSVICGGTTSTGALQNTTAGTAGQVLISGGSAALPTYRNTAAFMAFFNANSTALTGATTYTFTTGTGAPPGTPGITVAFDTTSSFAASTGLFTAPVTGRYYFSTSWYIGTLAGANNLCTITLTPSTTNRTFQNVTNIGAGRTAGNFNTVECEAIIDMAANDTMKATINITGNNPIIQGSSSNQYTFFAGNLITTQ